MLKGDRWKNHEETFEEALRREMLAEKTQRFLLQEDLKQLTDSYYKVLRENDRLKHNNALANSLSFE